MDKVKQFLSIAGVERNQESIDLYRWLFVEEVTEFWTAWGNRDRTEMLDGICDAWFIANSLEHLDFHIGNGVVDSYHHINQSINSMCDASNLLDFQVQEGFKIVCDSNMSKFDNDAYEAEQTAIKYSRLGVDTCQRKDLDSGKYATLSECDQRDFDGKFYPLGKLLKSAVNYFDPDFSEIL